MPRLNQMIRQCTPIVVIPANAGTRSRGAGPLRPGVRPNDEIGGSASFMRQSAR
jgi:hypothetical protein